MDTLKAVPAEILTRLSAALRIMTQANCSMGAVAKEITVLEYVDGVLCPEFLVPLLVKSTSETLNMCYGILEELENLVLQQV